MRAKQQYNELNFHFELFQVTFTPYITSTHLWQFLTSLGASGEKKGSMQNLRQCLIPSRYWWQKKPCNVIGWEHILVYNLKLNVLNWGKNSFFVRNSLFFVVKYFLSCHTFQTNQKHPSKSRHIWAWLGTPDHCKPKVGVSVVTFPYLHAKTLRESFNLTGWEHLGYNLWTRIFLDIGFAQENREL